jgi:glutathione S-transferase
MIRLIKFPPAFGLPDPSPFCIKVMVLLKMANLAYEVEEVTNPGKGPKGKLPAIEDDGRLIGDSEIIRWHLETKYGVDFDKGLGERERAQAHAFCRMLEERTYWIEVYNRWLEPEHFALLKAAFFAKLPPVVGPIVTRLIQRKVRRSLLAQGVGRHAAEERARMGAADVAAVAAELGDKPFFMGAEPTGADATVYAFLAGVIDPPFASPMKEAALRRANLVAYNGRLREQFFG